MKPYLLELALYGVSIIVGAIVFFLGKSKDRKINFLISLLTTVILFFITSHYFIRWEYLDRIIKNQEYIENLKADDESVNIAVDLSKSKRGFSNDNNNFFERIFSERKTEFREFLNELSEEQIVYNQKDFPQFERDVIKIFDELQTNQVVLATSRVDTKHWWKKEKFGDQYLLSNKNCVLQKQVIIKRIWIFDNEAELFQNKQNLEYQKEIGIETYYVFNSQIRDIVEKKRDIIVIGDIYAGELILNDRDMSKVIFYSNYNIVKEIKKNWDDLRKKAKKY
jgi:hypothetical protein